MIRQLVPKLGIVGLLTILFLVACGNSGSTPVTETPPATFTPEPLVAKDLLSTGDMAPDFTLPDGDGNLVSLTDQLRDNQQVVLVFYSDYT